MNRVAPKLIRPGSRLKMLLRVIETGRDGVLRSVPAWHNGAVNIPRK
jgi:hypothetical protein